MNDQGLHIVKNLVYLLYLIAGHRGDWICLCKCLSINHTSLYHLDPRQRFLDILKEYQKSCTHDLSVKDLYGIFKQVGNENSADRLIREAQRQLSGEFHGTGDKERSPTDEAHSGRYRHRSQYCSITQDQNNDDVRDCDINKSYLEDYVVV